MRTDYLNDQIKSIITTSHENLFDWLKYIVEIDCGKKTLESDVKIYDIHNYQGFSGVNFWVDNIMVGQLQIATLQACGFVIYRRLFMDGNLSESYEYYNQDGASMFTQNTLDGGTIMYNSINMDPSNPFINHLYNILSTEYDQTSTGFSRTRLVFTVESILNKLYDDKKIKISANARTSDQALSNIFHEMKKTELDPVLIWDERQSIYKNLRQIRSKIIRTKKRVHGFAPVGYDIPVFVKDIGNKASLIKARPLNNLSGIFYQLTIGNLFWFLKTVKANLGLSIAMAIYTPFTFYFITQPMNPHAMQGRGAIQQHGMVSDDIF